MPQRQEGFQACNLEQVDSQVEELSVSGSGAMRVLEGLDDQSVLLVVDEVAAQVVNHDCVIWLVEVGKFSPQEGQRLALKQSCLRQATHE